MKAPAFQFYAQDFLTGCTYLTNEEIGMYIKMLCKQWTDGNIPKKRLGFLVGINWDDFSDELKSKFTDFDDYVLNERLEIERKRKSNFHEKQSENGKKGGRPSKNKKYESTENTEEKTQIKPNGFKNQKPNQNQKNPLEEEIEVEEEIVKEKRKEGSGEKQKLIEPEIEVVFPFETETFKAQWQLWKIFRDKEHKFKYKTKISEQAALSELNNLSKSDEKTAIGIIHQSMAKGWKGFFELKNNSNGKQKSNSESRVEYSDDFKRKIAERLQS